MRPFTALGWVVIFIAALLALAGEITAAVWILVLLALWIVFVG
jgi:hypothetical protein